MKKYSATRKWLGKWIAGSTSNIYFQPAPPAPIMRTTFNAPENIREAVVHLCALGVHELYINGVKAGDIWYAPALTQYDYHDSYLDYDISGLIRPGKNSLCVLLGNGFYNSRNNWKYTVNFSSWRSRPKLLCDVEINRRTVESSGVHWKVCDSPITFDSRFEGEDYDARLEIPGCMLPEFDDSAWRSACRTVPPGGIVEKENIDPCRVLREISPVNITHPAENITVFDYGINLAGCVEIAVSGPAGAVVTLRYGELLYPDGRVDTEDIAAAQQGARFQTDNYILKGGGQTEYWHAHFVRHGFQYVEISVSVPEVTIHRAQAKFIASEMKKCGEVHTSDRIFNRIRELAETSFLANFAGIPFDCPTREKFGWLGDASLTVEPGLWNFNCRKGYEQLAQIILDIQRPGGCLSTHGPTTLWGFEQGSPGADIFYFRFARLVYEFYGDDSLIRQYYPALKKVLKYSEELADKNLIHFGFGDAWNPLGYGNKKMPSPRFGDPTMIDTVMWYENLQDMARFAKLLNHPADVRYCEKRCRMIAQTVHETFFDPENDLYDNASWAATALALISGIVPEKLRQKVAFALVSRVREAGHKALVGTVGARCVPRALAEYGYPQDAFKMFTQTAYPGWGFMAENGAASLWELWNGSCSRNHNSFCDVYAWSYRYLAGFSPAEPGFRRISIRPCLIPQLDSFAAAYQTPHGQLSIRWERTGKKINCAIRIPDGCTADIILPDQEFHGASGKIETVITDLPQG
ncbi:MAG: hypothetical protein E7058_05490 [Lentisphaerae bacterium]|nr:hypothetical protein [Lentisphaerota bacterium]